MYECTDVVYNMDGTAICLYQLVELNTNRILILEPERLSALMLLNVLNITNLSVTPEGEIVGTI